MYTSKGKWLMYYASAPTHPFSSATHMPIQRKGCDTKETPSIEDGGWHGMLSTLCLALCNILQAASLCVCRERDCFSSCCASASVAQFTKFTNADSDRNKLVSALNIIILDNRQTCPNFKWQFKGTLFYLLSIYDGLVVYVNRVR